MQKERDCLQKDPKSAKAHIQDLCRQNLEKDLKLQRAKAKLNQYDLKYRKPELELVWEHEQRRHAWKKHQKAIIQWDEQAKASISNESVQNPWFNMAKDVQAARAAAKASHNKLLKY